ncbi:MAG: OmpA family protein [Saprospirales bacterium]|nr:OmpA family protein [Saprospirales bacterium]
MDKVVAFLKKNNKLKIEIGGHTNGLCDDAFCNQLSNNRAKTCVDYLMSKGISKDRLQYKGYGKQFLIASPGSPLNQRVEIKILSVG